MGTSKSRVTRARISDEGSRGIYDKTSFIRTSRLDALVQGGSTRRPKAYWGRSLHRNGNWGRSLQLPSSREPLSRILSAAETTEGAAKSESLKVAICLTQV